MALLGWTLASLDNLRQGRFELAPAGFAHLGRGARLWLVLLLYGLLLVVIAAVIFVPGILLIVAAGGAAGGAAAAGILLTGVAALVFFVLSLLFALIQPLVYVQTDRGGVGGGLDLRAILHAVRTRFLQTMLAALVMYVGSLIGSLGAILCFVGLIFTVPYGYAVVAGVLYVYEQQRA